VMMKELVKDQRSSIFLVSNHYQYKKVKSDEDIIKLEMLDEEIKDFERLIENPNLRNLNASKNLLSKYNVDNDCLMHYDKISLLTQFKVWDGVLNEANPIIEKLRIKENDRRQKDLRVIITNRQSRYFENQEYELELEVVSLYNDIKDCDFFVEIDGQRSNVHSFPFLLPKNTKNGQIVGGFKNSTSGEERTIKKNIFP